MSLNEKEHLCRQVSTDGKHHTAEETGVTRNSSSMGNSGSTLDLLN